MSPELGFIGVCHHTELLMWVLVLVFAQQALLTEPSPPPFNTFYLLHFLTKIRLIQYCSIPKICLHIAYSVSGFIGDNISYFVPEMSLFISPLFYRDIFIRQVTLSWFFFSILTVWRCCHRIVLASEFNVSINNLSSVFLTVLLSSAPQMLSYIRFAATWSWPAEVFPCVDCTCGLPKPVVIKLGKL